MLSIRVKTVALSPILVFRIGIKLTMLLSFTTAVIFAAALLYLPGYLILRGIGFCRNYSIGIAPSVGVALAGVLSIFYAMIGVKSTSFNLFYLPLAVGVFSYLISCYKNHFMRDGICLRKEKDTVSYSVVIAVGVLLGMLFFARRLPSLDAIVQQWDYPHHLNAIKSFVDSGNLSPIKSSPYALGWGINPFNETTGFYPSGWHVVCALTSMGCRVSVPLSINAVNFAFSFIVFPVSMEALLVKLFPDSEIKSIIVSVACLSLTVFPWGLLTFGPIFPNLSGYAALPGVICAFMHSVDEKKVGMLFIWSISCIGIIFLHPNVLFSMGIYLAFFIFHLIRSRNITFCISRYCVKTKVISLGFTTLCLALWIIAYKSSFLASAVNVRWSNYASISQAIVDLITLSYVNGFPPYTAAQLVPAFVLVVGAISLWRDYDGKDRWILCPFVLSAAFMVVAESLASDNMLKSILTGFWYTDPYRIAAMTTIFSMPVLVKGVNCCIYKVDQCCGTKSEGRTRRRNAAAVVILYFCLAFYPTFQIAGVGSVKMAFSDLRDNIQTVYGYGTPLAEDEQRFLIKTKEIVGNALVINEPFDGSMMAYGTNGINCYYRYFNGFGIPSETMESVAIRQKLNLIENDAAVRESVKSIGARYVLLLDNSNAESSFTASAYQKDQWKGIESITDKTSGFSLILKEANYRLYKIDGIE